MSLGEYRWIKLDPGILFFWTFGKTKWHLKISTQNPYPRSPPWHVFFGCPRRPQERHTKHTSLRLEQICFQSVPIHSTGSAQFWLSKIRSRGALGLSLHSMPYYRFHLLVTHRIRLPNTLRSTLQAESGRWLGSASFQNNRAFQLQLKHCVEFIFGEECKICNQPQRPLVEPCLTATTPPAPGDKITNLGTTGPNLRTSHASLWPRHIACVDWIDTIVLIQSTTIVFLEEINMLL